MAKYVKTEQGYKEIEAINSNKMDKNNPVGTGSFSMGRKYGSLIGLGSHAEGNNTTASGPYSHAEGHITTASGSGSHAEGYRTTASGVDSHAEGYSTTASGEYSHAEGSYTIASGFDSHAEGYNTTASGSYSHVEGYNTTASGNYSHAEGKYTKASGTDSHVEGKYNIDDTANKYAHIVGNGTSNTSRSNAHTLDWNGVGWFKDSVKVGGSSQDDSAAKTLATTDYVDTTISTKISGKQDTLIQSGASVGQIAKITAVDSSGKPTAWEAVDMPSGGSETWEKIAEIVIPEGADESTALTISQDFDGNPFSLVKARLCAKFPKYTGETSIPRFSFAMLNGKTTGSVSPLAYTSVWPEVSKSNATGTVYEIDVSGIQQIEHVIKSLNSGWSPDTPNNYIIYGTSNNKEFTIIADTLWAKPITSIGGAGMLIYPGCRFVLYGVRA